MSNQHISEAFDEARWIDFTTKNSCYVWFGGHQVHIYSLNMDSTLHEMTVFNVGSFEKNASEITLPEIKDAIEDWKEAERVER